MRKADGLLKMEIVMFLRTVNLGTFGKDKSKLGISVVNLGELCVLLYLLAIICNYATRQFKGTQCHVDIVLRIMPAA